MNPTFFCATKWLYLLYSLSDKFYYILLLSVLFNKVYFSTCHSSILLLCFANIFSLINSILPLFSIIAFTDKKFLFNFEILGVVKRNPLFLHEIEWKNNGFLFTTPNIYNFFQLIILKFNNSWSFSYHCFICLGHTKLRIQFSKISNVITFICHVCNCSWVNNIH